jgi:hypothetical protein
MQAAGLTDEQLIARAEAAGWKWVVNATGKWYCHGDTKPVTGWEHDHSFISATVETKCKNLRQNQHTGAGRCLCFDHDLDCHFCKDPIYLAWLDDAELIRLKECRACNHWLGLRRGGRSIVIEQDGGRSHYQAGKNKTPGRHNGFGGNLFRIKFTDGRVEECCDLWHQGTIPERYYDLFPVNAEFL